MDAIQSLITEAFTLASRFAYWEFLLGLFGAYGLTRLRDRRIDNRLRTATREALALETIRNLAILDYWESALLQVTDGGELLRPSSDFHLQAIDQSLNPSVSATLSAEEQTRIVVLASHLKALSKELQAWAAAEANDDWAHEILGSPMFPIVGTSLVSVLIVVIREQGRFASSHTTEVARKLVPALDSTGFLPHRMWRSSDFGASNKHEGVLVVWQDDEPDLVPDNVPIIALQPSETVRITIHPPKSLFARIRRHYQLWQIRNGIRHHDREAQRLTWRANQHEH